MQADGSRRLGPLGSQVIRGAHDQESLRPARSHVLMRGYPKGKASLARCGGRHGQKVRSRMRQHVCDRAPASLAKPPSRRIRAGLLRPFRLLLCQELSSLPNDGFKTRVRPMVGSGRHCSDLAQGARAGRGKLYRCPQTNFY